jgi:hypothetical protein
MEERGVSKIVSMRFDHVRGVAEPVVETVADAVRQARTKALDSGISAPAPAAAVSETQP